MTDDRTVTEHHEVTESHSADGDTVSETRTERHEVHEERPAPPVTETTTTTTTTVIEE